MPLQEEMQKRRNNIQQLIDQINQSVEEIQQLLIDQEMRLLEKENDILLNDLLKSLEHYKHITFIDVFHAKKTKALFIGLLGQL